MDIREVSYNPEPKTVFEAKCEHCNHTWPPFKDTNRTISPPTEITLVCPNCEKKTVCFFADKEMKKEILYRRHVLGYDNKIKNATKKVEVVTKERDEWKKRYEGEYATNEKLINVLDRLVKKLEDIDVEIDDSDKKYRHFT